MFGGSGLDHNLKQLATELKRRLKNREYTLEDNLRDRVEDTLLFLHKKYNIDRSNFLGINKLYFSPNAILGARLTLNGKPISYRLFSLGFDGVTTEIEDYESIGSGSILADLLFKIFKRGVIALGGKMSDFNVEDGVRIASWIINEVKQTDLYSSAYSSIYNRQKRIPATF